MRTIVKGITLIFSAIAVSAWAQPLQTESDLIPAVSEIATSFTNYDKITANAVFVNPELAMLCRGVSKEEVDAARIKFGPHANTAVLIYMNKAAGDAFGTNASVFPVGAVVVKQKTILGYLQSGQSIREANTGVGGMVKRPAGYDPAHGDWEYFYFENPAKIESGHIASCVQCHEAAKEKDHVFGTWRTAIHQAPSIAHAANNSAISK